MAASGGVVGAAESHQFERIVDQIRGAIVAAFLVINVIESA